MLPLLDFGLYAIGYYSVLGWDFGNMLVKILDVELVARQFRNVFRFYLFPIKHLRV